MLEKSKSGAIAQATKNNEVDTTYRPICLLSVLTKILENIIKAQLTQELEKNNAIDKNQYGFTKGKSTTDAVQRVIQTVDEI